MMKWKTLGVMLYWLIGTSASNASASEAVDFNREIRPIFAEHCLECHGPDEGSRQAELRLDQEASVFGERDGPLITRGESNTSELFRRLIAEDPDERMPPADTGRSLSAEQIERIRQWIDEGARWDDHWAFVPPRRPKVPEGNAVINEIDPFVLRRLNEQGLVPSEPAGRVELVRRLHFDLLGLPPSPQDVASFVEDTSSDAYHATIDRLLESPHFGERMAIYWLDVVRYADSNGYHSDEPRSVAPYRDYVISAFNANKPFDQFVIEQLAGDLLSDASMEQRIASGFNMLLQTTNEGGAQAKEYLAKYMADRVRNTSTVFFGVTMGCAECHDHKFDPFTMKDFYGLGSLFADIREVGVGNPPSYPAWNPQQGARLQQFEQQIGEIERRLISSTPDLETARHAWEDSLASLPESKLVFESWYLLGPIKVSTTELAFEYPYIPETKLNLAQSLEDHSWRKMDDFEDGKVHALEPQETGVSYLFRRIHVSRPTTALLSLGAQEKLSVWVNGGLVFEDRSTDPAEADEHTRFIHLEEGENRILIKIAADKNASFYFRLSPSAYPAGMETVFKTPRDQRTESQREQLRAHYLTFAPQLSQTRRDLAKMKRQKYQFLYALPQSLMTVATSPRTIRILPRGNWLDESGPEVGPAVPIIFEQLADAETRPTRLDFARWTVDRKNPLTARVFVNRLWKLFFGRGLAVPLDDFGARGTRPTHPELLDWLAVEFMDSGWDVKHMVKQMVTSATYQQTSRAVASLRERDPHNEWYARQARFRLDAEMVRDNALAVSGLLVRKIGGRSVKPYQPAGYWRHMNFPVRTWQHDEGEQLYRRGLYTWWQRMFLHPSMVAFDAPSREECTVERARSNTPQQALVLLNDPTYVEAARTFAEQVLRHGGADFSGRVDWAYRRALSRDAVEQEREALHTVYARHLEEYRKDQDAAQNLVANGLRSVSEDLDMTEIAAWTSVTRIILNLHETVTRN